MNKSDRLSEISERLRTLNAFMAETDPLLASVNYTLHFGYSFDADGSGCYRCLLTRGSESMPPRWQRRLEQGFSDSDTAATHAERTIFEFTQLRIIWHKYRASLGAEIERIAPGAGATLSTMPDAPAITLATRGSPLPLDPAPTLDAWRRTPTAAGLSALARAAVPWSGAVSSPDQEQPRTSANSTRKARRS